MFDLAPAATEMSRLVAGVRDDQLDAPTPCEDWTVRELLAHVHQFVTVFTLNARKEEVEFPDGLPEDWRRVLPAGLDGLVEAWRDPAAWEGQTSAGGIEMTGEQNALVAIEELVLHGWDVARASGQDFRVDDASVERVAEFQETFREGIESDDGPYGPRRPAADDASHFQRLLAVAGRG